MVERRMTRMLVAARRWLTERLGPGRDGFALAAAILAMVVIGAIVTGGFYTASQEGRIGESTRFAGEAFQVAERGANEIAGTWMRARFEQIPVGGQFDTTMTYAEGTARVSVRRLADRLYFVESTGEGAKGGRYRGATRQVGLFLRTKNFAVRQDRAMQIFGRLWMRGTSEIHGEDQIPTGWSDCEDAGAQAGVVAPDISKQRIDIGGSAEVTGDPPLRADPTLSQDDFTRFGDIDIEELIAMAQSRGKVIPPGTTVTQIGPAVKPGGTACDTGRLYNWGAPADAAHPCHFYFPIIYAAGNLKINADGAGQGILVVDGDLTIRGQFRFYGVTIVRGSFEAEGGAELYGSTVVWGNGVVDTNKVTGNAVVNFSSCAIQRAQEYNDDLARPFPLVARSWIDLSALLEQSS